MNLQYPIGEFSWPETITDADRALSIADIAALPYQLRQATTGLNDTQLDTPYRPEGWTIRQVIHHIADSHINSYIRFKLALTEDNPTIRPYDEAAWAELPEARTGDPELSLAIIQSLHTRWVHMLNGLTPEQLTRTFDHPEWQAPVSLDRNIALYAWHSKHHLAHITTTIEREGW